MRHRVKTRKLSRTPAHRKALARNMAAALIEHERIETTLTKAKAHRPFVEKLVTLSKEKTLHNYRRALALLGNNKAAVAKLFDVLGPRFLERPGGYTRVLKMAKPRLGDNAPRAIFEFVERSEGEEFSPELAAAEAASAEVTA
ncbi:MAG: 50S ribosomal protein L17 [Planctomycetota bacterium]|jgi:large subunit ribosomal protein L17|nr:50S ribosomal protein L17 [Planctomycetota bacterium]